MRKSVVLLLSIAVAVALVACSSAPAAQPTTAPAAPKAAEPTKAAAPAAAPTTAPAAAAQPTAAPAAKAAAPGMAGYKLAAKSSKELAVAVVPGGPHPYFAPMQPSIAQAVKDFGLAKGEYRAPQEWTLNAQNQVIDSMVAQGFNAFLIFPGDANGSNGKFDELAAKGIPVITVGGSVNEPTRAVFSFATDVGNSAYLGTKELIKAMGGKGALIHGSSFLVDPNTQARVKAVQRAVDETNGAATLFQTIPDVDDQEKADKAINSFLAANKDKIQGMFSTAYVCSTVMATSLRNIGDKKLKAVLIDDDPIVLNGIKDGFVNGTMVQNPWGQAYLGAYVMKMLADGYTKKAGSPYFIDSGTMFVDTSKIASYPDDLKVITKQIQDGFVDKYLVKP